MSSIEFDAPAAEWLEALPLGNGSLGVMCHGGTSTMRFDLNDETAWSGSASSESRQPRPTAAEAAELWAAARSDPAGSDAALQAMQSSYSQAYLPLGVIEIDLPDGEVADYRRSLDLATGVHTVAYRAGAERVTHTTYVSASDGVLVHVTEGARGRVRVSSPHRGESDDPFVFRLPSDVPPGHEPQFAVQWDDDALRGTIVTREFDDGGRHILLVATGTSYTGADFVDRAIDRLDRAAELGADALLARHLDDIVPRLARVRIDLPERADAARLFDYGRYLLLSSSRPGGLPATLQGIWNDSMQPPWSSNYTININTQMNYWQAEVANLPETVEPLIDFIEALAAAGAETAARLYGARGWVAHHNSDAWHYTSPVGAGHGDPSWAFWPMAGPWLVRHLWEHVEFGSADATFLENRAWPLLRSTATFLLDVSARRADGTWGTSPSTSPENTYRDADGNVRSVTESSAMDLQLIDDVFTIVIEAARRLGLEGDPVAVEVRERLAVLSPGVVVAASGILREFGDDETEVDPQHRHLSPLYALYPGRGVLDDAQRAAATRTLERRGDDSTGWSVAWKIALWARLGRGDKVDDLLEYVFRDAATTTGPWAGGLYPNLFSAAPPFQIDGNLGYVAALAECLVQSHAGVIDLLPALPPSLGTGSITGLVARPGVVVDLTWSDGRLESATLTARTPVTVDITIRSARITRALTAEPTTVSIDDFAESSTTA